jgi:hypothetical protein
MDKQRTDTARYRYAKKRAEKIFHCPKRYYAMTNEVTTDRTSSVYYSNNKYLYAWRVSANILNKQLRTADKGWSSSLEVGHGAKNSSP